MIQVGIIGTSVISHEFAKALQLSGLFQVKGVYSRTLSKAQRFGKDYGADLFYDQMEDFMASPNLDAIYIASPNSLHFEQTLLALENGKHVVVEKPAFSTVWEWDTAFQLAEAKGLFLFEAARHLHAPIFNRVKDEIAKLDSISGAVLSFGKYSSRYDLVLEGFEPNIFSPAFSGGALMDLGVYLLYAALSFFGEPETGRYFPKIIPTGVDGAGTIVLRYPTFDVTMPVSKITNMFARSEIYSGQKTLLLDSVSVMTFVELYDGEKGTTVELASEESEHLMLDEVRTFAKILENTSDTAAYEEWKTLSRVVAYWTEKLRKEAGIFFPADVKE